MIVTRVAARRYNDNLRKEGAIGLIPPVPVSTCAVDVSMNTGLVLSGWQVEDFLVVGPRTPVVGTILPSTTENIRARPLYAVMAARREFKGAPIKIQVHQLARDNTAARHAILVRPHTKIRGIVLEGIKRKQRADSGEARHGGPATRRWGCFESVRRGAGGRIGGTRCCWNEREYN